MKGIVDIMKNKKRFFYHRLLFYILGLLIMSVGSNLFLKAALGVAPSCTMALTLSYLSPVHSYALFNFQTNSDSAKAYIFLIRDSFHKSFHWHNSEPGTDRESDTY